MDERPSVYRLTCAEMLRQVARSRQAPMKDQREMLERLAANIEAGGSAELERAVIDLGETVEASFKIMEATRRAGLSPIARTEIAAARAAFAVVWGWVACGPKIAPDDVYEASGRVFKLLDSVLGAESTKETK